MFTIEFLSRLPIVMKIIVSLVGIGVVAVFLYSVWSPPKTVSSVSDITDSKYLDQNIKRHQKSEVKGPQTRNKESQNIEVRESPGAKVNQSGGDIIINNPDSKR